MTLLYTDRAFRQHITGSHPEHPRRLVAIDEHLDRCGLTAQCAHPQWQPATVEQLERVHDPHYVQHLQPTFACSCLAVGRGLRVDSRLVPRLGFAVDPSVDPQTVLARLTLKPR